MSYGIAQTELDHARDASGGLSFWRMARSDGVRLIRAVTGQANPGEIRLLDFLNNNG